MADKLGKCCTILVVKKVRITLKRGCKEWSFPIYDSSESAYYLKDEPFADDIDDCCKLVTLKKGEVLEIEWMGYEAVYEDEISLKKKPFKSLSHEKFHSIRVGKLTPVKMTTHKTGYVETFVGWVNEDTKLFSDIHESVKILHIKGRVLSKMDFSQIFLSDSSSEEDSEKKLVVLN